MASSDSLSTGIEGTNKITLDDCSSNTSGTELPMDLPVDLRGRGRLRRYGQHVLTGDREREVFSPMDKPMIYVTNTSRTVDVTPSKLNGGTSGSIATTKDSGST